VDWVAVSYQTQRFINQADERSLASEKQKQKQQTRTDIPAQTRHDTADSLRSDETLETSTSVPLAERHD